MNKNIGIKISYCVTACNEHIELEKLLRFLKRNIREEDEVIIQLDSINTTNEVQEVCNLFTGFNHEKELVDSITNSKSYQFPLNDDFATFKNELFKQSTGDYIFSIDADEIPHIDLIKSLPLILEQNSKIDVFFVPRVNTVKDITPEHITKWGWNVNNKGWINFPDYQMRIYKNKPEIKWIKPVHEILDGFKTFSHLPAEEVWSLYHPKDIKRQEKQNQYYESL
jgi:cellulose synthase/poly-beta-1,6-N-acetylglucosamine synthase-like glycosyltransferase